MSERVGRTVGTVGEYLREQRRAAEMSLRQLADLAGVSNPYLSQVERGLRRPSAEVLQQLARALRISAEQLYVRAGILSPDEGGERSVQLAILADRVLTERQRQVLLDIYQTFRREAEAEAGAGGTTAYAASQGPGTAEAEQSEAPATEAG